MISINKIIVALVIVQLAVVLAKPKREYDDGLFHSNDNMDDYFYKRATDCGGDCEPEGCYSRRCRSSCRSGERHISMYDNKCGGEEKCCMCHTRWGSCTYDG